MPKTGISVTIEEANLLWLKSRTVARKGRSVSETLDHLVTAARTGGTASATQIRSVVGTIDIAADDPDLRDADEYVRGLFESSASMPYLARETPPPYRTGRRTTNRRRG